MKFSGLSRKRRFGALTAVVVSGLFIAGFLESCDDRLVALTTFFDPCGTILADCEPGFFQGQAAGIGNPCWDAGCTVPGACGDQPPLGATFDLCP